MSPPPGSPPRLVALFLTTRHADSQESTLVVEVGSNHMLTCLNSESSSILLSGFMSMHPSRSIRRSRKARYRFEL